MAFRRSDHVFHAVVDNFHGASGFHCQQRGMRRDHGRVFFFSAERSAGFHLHDAHFFFGQRKKGHQGLVHVVWALQGTPNGGSVFRVERRDHAVVFDIELFLRAGEIFALDDVRRFIPDGFDVALFNQVTLERVVSAPNDCGLQLAFFDGV